MHGVTQSKVAVTCGSPGKAKLSKTIMSLMLVLALAFSSLALAACSSPEPAPTSSASASAPSETENVGYKQKFLIECEAWVDNFVLFVDKYKANPSDPDLNKEIDSWASELTEWSTVGNAIKPYLTGSDLGAWTEITGKFNSANNELGEAQRTANAATTPTPSTGSTDYKQFLAEYEAWVDKYVDFMTRFKANPTDMSLLTEYSSLATEQIEWSKKANDIQGKITGEDLQTLNRITQKLTSALM